jgi:hypothetical protein
MPSASVAGRSVRVALGTTSNRPKNAIRKTVWLAARTPPTDRRRAVTVRDLAGRMSGPANST